MALAIHPLVTARLAAEKGRLTYLRDYGQTIWLPAPFYVVLGGPEPVLVDTSGQAEVMRGLRSEPVEHVQGFEEALARVGLRPAEVGLVVHTHLMYDHCANSGRLPRARLLVQRKELDFALDPHPMYAGVYQRRLFEGLNFQVVEGDAEVFPGLSLLFTPGHTPGGQSVAVQTAAGLAVITGFCCLGENFAPQKSPAWVTDRVPEVIPPGIHTDMLQAYESMLRVRDLADILIPFHEPEMTGRSVIPG